MSDQFKVLAFVLVGFMSIMLVLFIGYFFPSTSGIIANMTTLSNTCKNCDSGVKGFGSNLPIILIGIIVSMLVITVVWAVKHYG